MIAYTSKHFQSYLGSSLLTRKYGGVIASKASQVTHIMALASTSWEKFDEKFHGALNHGDNAKKQSLHRHYGMVAMFFQTG